MPRLLRLVPLLSALCLSIAVSPGARAPIATQAPLGTQAPPAAQAPLSSLPAAERLVAIGDLHADLDASRRAFRLAGAIDERDRWIGGTLVVVQLGDVIGRGREDRAVLDFVLDLQARAKAGGGAVHVLIGNHEVFAARPDHRWVDASAFAAFHGIPGLNLAHPRVADLPFNERARAAAFLPGGVYAKRLAALPAVLRVGDTVFAHGGVLPVWASYGIERINADVSAWLHGLTDEPKATLGFDDGTLEDGVMWSRHFAAAPDEAACALLDESLRLLGARRMVVAHTVRRTIGSRCNNRLWTIDVGISQYYGGEVQVLEIVRDRDVRPITVVPGPEP